MRGQRPADCPGCPATVAEAVAAGRQLRPTRWGLRDAVIAVAGSLLLGVLYVLVVAAVAADGPSVTLLTGPLVGWLALAGWPIWATRRFGNGPVVDLGLRCTRGDVLWGVAGGLVATVVAAAAAWLTARLLGPFDSAAAEAAATSGASRWALVVFALIVAVGGPFVEELAFRGMLWSGLARLGMRPWLTLATTTVVFAVAHFELRRIGVLLVVGLVLGLLRLHTGRLGASIIAHGVNNLPGAIAIAVA